MQLSHRHLTRKTRQKIGTVAKVTVASKVVENDFTLSSAKIAALLILFTASTAACRKWWFINSILLADPHCSSEGPCFDLKTFFSLELVEEIVTNSFRNDTGAFREYLALPAPSATSNTLHPDTSLKLR